MTGVRRLTRALVFTLLVLLATDLASVAQCCGETAFPQQAATASLTDCTPTTDSESHDCADCFCCGRSLASSFGFSSLPDMMLPPPGVPVSGFPASDIVPQYHPPQL